MEQDLNLASLQQKGFLKVAYPKDLRLGVEKAIEAWKVFCALPEEKKLTISYSGDTNMSGVGYELKKSQEGGVDLKEDFHLRLSERGWIESQVSPADIEMKAFVDAALALNELVAPTIRSFAKAAEEQFGMSNFEKDTMEWQPIWLLRFLHYFGDREPGEEMAAPHADKGGFTLHLYESHTGLEHLTYDKFWEPMDFGSAETAIIPGMRMQYRSDNQLKATYHRVVANEQSAKEGRFSAVCFAGFANTPNHDKKRHGRMQDYPLAFNYAMPFEEFKTLFTND